MTMEAFISYAHVDDARRERLHKHLVTLHRDGMLRSWSDHEILAGDRFSNKISDALETSGLFIALLSPDYLASNYCYDIEFKRALELEAQGQMRIAGIVVEPCDWKNSPFAKLKILPKDGKPVSDWTNENTAFLNVAEELRRLLSPPAVSSRESSSVLAKSVDPTTPGRRLKVKQDFDAIQRAEYADGAFEKLRAYFEDACDELNGASDQIKAKFEEMSKTAFTCTIVNRAKIRGGEAHITVHRKKGGRMSVGEISYVFAPHADDGTSNGWLNVHADDYRMFLQGTIGGFGIHSDKTYSAEEAATALWDAFMKQAGLEFET